jgi:IS30 family transposase
MPSGRQWTAAERIELWRQYKAGESTRSIGLALGRAGGCIFSLLVPAGGIAPQPRRRAPRVLSFEEREEISRGLAASVSIRSIARRLGRAPSTVSREVRRHSGKNYYNNPYRARTADSRAWNRARRAKRCLLDLNRALQRAVAGKLQLDWSPEQISGWLKEQYPADESMRVSHETIYRTLFVQARGALKKELLGRLRGKRRIRRSRVARKKDGRGQIADAISIRERPAEIEDRAVPGHWEGDLLLGSKNSHIATLVERQSRFTTLIKLQSRDTDAVVGALARHIRKLPTELRRSLTWDRGREMKHHKDFTVATDVKVYFCDPSSPWQRGTNENTNGLLRQYFPKGTDLSEYSQAYLDKIALRLNQRPRKTLGFKTPADKLQESVALTH